jgi:signal-transduction protein with cAMP-binding, CBS, and nucleotidyltransferase domain
VLSEDTKGPKRNKAKHLKRLGRTNTVSNLPLVAEDMKTNKVGAVVRRPQQQTIVGNVIRKVDINKIREAINEPAKDNDENPDLLELKALTSLDKATVNENESFLLKEAFSRHFLLGNISLNAIESILKKMDYFKLGSNKILFDQGDTGMHLFILTKGLLEVTIDGETVSLINEGNAFGEIALIYSCKRTAQIKSKDEECHLYTIHRDNFREIMKNISDQSTFVRTNVVRELRIFQFIDRDTRSKLSEHIIPMKFSKEDVIIRKGIKETLYVITRGRVRKQSSNNSSIACHKVFKKGRIIGFSTMINDSSLHDTYICETDVDCINISGDTLRTIFGKENFKCTILRMFLEDVLEEKRISSSDTAREASYNDEEAKFEEEKIPAASEDDNSPVGY